MVKKLLGIILLCMILSMGLSAQSWTYKEDCIASDIATIASLGTATNGSEFTAVAIKVQRINHSSVVAITIEFTIAAANGDDIDFYFQASYDNGTTWSTDAFVIVDVASTADPSGTTVRHTELVNVYGISHLRLYKVVNNDAVTAITAVNAYISGGK